MKQKLICYTILLLLIFGGMQSVAAKSYGSMKHGLWTSHIIKAGGAVSFRASTVARINGKPVALTFDRKLNNCGSQYVTMNFQLPRRARRSYQSRNYFGEMRIDTHRIHSVNYRVRKYRGSQFAYIRLTNFDGDKSIVRELKYGRVVRFRLKTDSNEYFFRFALPGYRFASARARRLCRTYHRNNDRRYFERTNDRSSDRDFFM